MKKKENEYSLRDIWDKVKHTNIWVIGVPEAEEKKKGTEKIFEEIIVESFHSMGKKTVSQDQEVQSPLQDKPKEKYINVNPWLIHVNVWQKPLQYGKVISLQLIKINEKIKKKHIKTHINQANRD